MLKEETNDNGVNNWSRLCGTCRSAACTVYCRADSAYLCTTCDSRVHAANRVASRHERVRICEACEQAPAAFLCKADAASLCTTCDAEIHSANPLARRHTRVPILPISSHETEVGFMVTEEDEDEAASWLLPNPGKNTTTTGFLFSGGEVDEYNMDLGDQYNSSAVVENQFIDQYNQHQQQSYGGDSTDSAVPIQSREAKVHQLQNLSFQYGLEDYFDSSKSSYSYNNGSITNTVSMSSVDIGVVPESTMSDIPISGPQIQIPSQLTPMDREARVLRYREKKKTRKFEKTIRYASRKAYAETRPRIKGRFAKRTDVEVEVDQMFSTTLMTENGYGIVPSF